MPDDIKAVRVRVMGRVQGVGFRAWTQREAVRLGLSGWVRNEKDGSVVALISGPPDAVDAMLERLGRGPLAASVRQLDLQEAEAGDVPDGFEVTR